jgi:branched-chain amino acid transport system ATP-binding protein
MLSVIDLNVSYGNFQVLFDINLEVSKGEIVALIGPNGAGKTTTLKTISGLLRPAKGKISFLGESLNGLQPYQICARGVVQVPEGRGIFPTMTVLENLEMGAYLPAARAKKAESLNKVFDLFPVLSTRKQQRAGSLSGGEQQMLAIGRALMALPKLLIIDELSLGLSPKIASLLFEKLKELNKQGLTILLVEQNVVAALEIAERAYIISEGRIITEGNAKDILSDKRIIKSYFGL